MFYFSFCFLSLLLACVACGWAGVLCPSWRLDFWELWPLVKEEAFTWIRCWDMMKRKKARIGAVWGPLRKWKKSTGRWPTWSSDSSHTLWSSKFIAWVGSGTRLHGWKEELGMEEWERERSLNEHPTWSSGGLCLRRGSLPSGSGAQQWGEEGGWM